MQTELRPAPGGPPPAPRPGQRQRSEKVDRPRFPRPSDPAYGCVEWFRYPLPEEKRERDDANP